MTDELFSVEKVAELLGLHVRTVRAYVREGKLKAVRIGKQYRIARADLETLTGGKPVVAHPVIPRHRHAEVSSVVQVDAISQDQANRISNTLMATAKGAHVSCQYNESHGRLKIILTSSLDTTAGLLKLINLLLEQAS